MWPTYWRGKCTVMFFNRGLRNAKYRYRQWETSVSAQKSLIGRALNRYHRHCLSYFVKFTNDVNKHFRSTWRVGWWRSPNCTTGYKFYAQVRENKLKNSSTFILTISKVRRQTFKFLQLHPWTYYKCWFWKFSRLQWEVSSLNKLTAK